MTDKWFIYKIYKQLIQLIIKKQTTQFKIWQKFAATWMELETLILSKVSQNEKDKYHTSLILESKIWHKREVPIVAQW